MLTTSGRLLVASALWTAGLAGRGYAQGPEYLSPDTRPIVVRMVEAHGGLARWRQAPTIRYDNVFFNPAEADAMPWWVARETIDQRTRRAYHDWTLDGAQLAYDGQRVWTVGWRQGNHPAFMALFFYYFLNLPWITQDANVVLGPPGRARLPNLDQEFDTVRVTFRPPHLAGRTGQDRFLLYIDPATHMLRAYEYVIGYGAMLDLMRVPPEALASGPVLRWIDDYTSVEGLQFPARMHTTNVAGTRTYGYHALINYSLSDPFDETRMRMPQGAVVDSSRAERASRQRVNPQIERAPGLARVQALLGEWEVEFVSPAGPSDSFVPLRTTSRIVPVLGGRFLQESIRLPTPQGPPIELIGLLGFDQYRRVYRFAWLDDTFGLLDVHEGERQGDSLIVDNVRARTTLRFGEQEVFGKMIWSELGLEGFVVASLASLDEGRTWFVQARGRYRRVAGSARE